MAPPRSDPADGPGRAPSMAELSELLTIDPASCPDGQISEGLEALLRHADLVDAAISRWAGAFDARSVWLGDGARSGASWLAARTEVSSPHASAVIHRARDLRTCPSVEEAYRSGAIGTTKVRALLRARKAHPVLFAEHEAGLVEHVTPLTVAHASTVIARWEQLAEATGDQQSAADHHDGDADSGADSAADATPEDPAAGNSLFLSRSLDGRWFGDLDLDPAAGDELNEALVAHVDRCFQQGTYRADDGLTTSRRKAEALVELALRGADPATTKHGDPRPSVTVQVDHQTLAGLPAEDLDDGLSRTCCLDDGTPVPRETVERLLCNARVSHQLTRIGEDGAVETLGITDLLRDANRRQRRAMKLRDGGCVFAGCSAPVDWCDAHHLTPYEIGGPTLLANLVFLCRFHHHQVHEGGWRMWRDEDASMRLQDPQGREVACPPHGHLVPPPPDPPSPSAPPPTPAGGQPPTGSGPPPRPSPPRFRRPREP